MQLRTRNTGSRAYSSIAAAISTEEPWRRPLARRAPPPARRATVASFAPSPSPATHIPHGTLLCVSDKPLHGEIKLPGAANAFYETAIAQHLKIGLAALDLLKESRDSLHSRKLRSFDEPPFR